MKILHVLSAFDVDFPGGITNYLRTLAASQVASGDDVFVVDGGESRVWRKHQLGFSVVGADSTQGDHFTVSMRRHPVAARGLVAFIAGQAPDIVHFHLTSGIGVDFYSEFIELHVPFVVSLHDYFLFCPRITMVDYSGDNCGGPSSEKCSRCIGVIDQVDVLFRLSRKTGLPLPRMRSSKLDRRNEQIGNFLGSAALVLAVSTRVREIYESVYPHANYAVSRIGSSSADIARPRKTASDKIRLTFIGTLAKFKGSEILERIAVGLTRDDISIEFFGRLGHPKAGKKLVEAGVAVRGSYEPSDLPRIMSNTDIGLVLPIWEDNAPQVVMEFLNYGVPVVATSMGGIPDFVGSENGFLFDPRSDDGVASAINFIESLDASEVRAWGKSLPRLPGPDRHQAEIRGFYEHALVIPQ
ncbi:glycosyltransferase [Cryobacterium sp. MDB2-33-2]|uniref:glycosyltransferase n=1 Tax=Cryobacterium sp. MDB2-33-2 TaxID=1259179 RepID=UPI00106BDF48|nr:glycosyltransferase [Cryobacterium sp. MDB2-33-2]TFC08845.1 glycosyltransferase [Cryobacterium sp. MDB2-33-2]